MEDSEKPFACSGCGMKFVLEDHLTQHKKKHEMSLLLSSSSIHKNAFVDQTPTPTRFIKNCDAVGLFQELQQLTVNPFDEEFRKAGHSGCPNPQAADDQVGDSLNTPTVISLTTERHVVEVEPGDIIFAAEEGMPLSFPSDVSKGDTEASQPIPVITRTTNLCKLPKKIINNTSDLPVSISNQMFNNHVSTTVPIVTSMLPSQAVQQPVQGVTLIIKLSDGQMPYVTTQPAIVSTQSAASSYSKVPVEKSSQIPTAEKLKAAISSRASKTHSIPSASGCNGSNGRNAGGSRLEMPEFCSSSSGRRGREEEDNPDEKRLKFLERNRAAAARCRTRKKQWVVALQRKADELASTNEHLQKEVAMLRNEVAKLKTMLLAHKDCPITQQQRAAGHPDALSIGMPSYFPPLVTTVKSVESTCNGVFVDSIEVEIASSDNSCDSKSLPSE